MPAGVRISSDKGRGSPTEPAPKTDAGRQRRCFLTMSEGTTLTPPSWRERVGWRRSPVFGGRLLLDRNRNRLGRWDDTLRVSP